MQASTPGIKEKTYASLSTINVTPLVDVVLVLLIIFMVTAPMMQAGVDVDLPRTSLASKEQAEERLVVTVTHERRLYVGERLIPFNMLVDTVRSRLGGSGQAVALKADRRLDYGYVLLVLDSIRRAGVENVGLIVNPLESPDGLDAAKPAEPAP